MEEQDSEGQGQVLLGWAAEGGAQQLQPSHRHQQRPAAVDEEQALGGRWDSRGAEGVGAHPSPALAWAPPSWALLLWARDAQSLLSKGVPL